MFFKSLRQQIKAYRSDPQFEGNFIDFLRISDFQKYHVKISDLILALDDKLDRQSSDKWFQYGETTLGDEPCEFLSNLFKPDQYEATGQLQNIERIVRIHGYAEKDIYQICNLMACQVMHVARAARRYKQEPTTENRVVCAQENVRLSVLSYMAYFVPARYLAGLIRKGGMDEKRIYDLLRSQYPDLYENGVLAQIGDDGADLRDDTRSERICGTAPTNVWRAAIEVKGLSLSTRTGISARGEWFESRKEHEESFLRNAHPRLLEGVAEIVSAIDNNPQTIVRLLKRLGANVSFINTVKNTTRASQPTR